MHTVKLTVFIEDNTDLAMEVHVVAPGHEAAMADATSRAFLERCSTRNAKGIDDEYELGGYAGI